jgi:hypothetical protein
MPALLCGSGLLALVKRLLPIAPVKIIVFELAQSNAFEASHVDVERLRIGARYIEDVSVGEVERIGI